MYYPYFRGRQSELLAIRDTVVKLAKKKKVVPIIEPVMIKTGGLKACLEAVKAQHPHVIIINPAVGDLVQQGSLIEGLITPYLAVPANNLIPGFHIGSSTTQAQIIAFLAKYGQRETVLVFESPNPVTVQGVLPRISAMTVPPTLVFIEGKVGPSLINLFTNQKKVLLRDGFVAKNRNADYPPLDFFSDLHNTYTGTGFHGFGDFSVIGDVFKPGGGPAHAVAIHLTELNANQEIYTNHFVSNRTTGAVDTPGKFMEALDKLVAHVHSRRRAFSFSQARAEFEAHHANQHFPGLPSVKRLAIRHHLELMEALV